MASTTNTKPATKPASKAKAGQFASVRDALTACGITQKLNMAGHIAAGRINSTGGITTSGKAYFAARLPDEQKALSGFMKKAGSNGFKTPSGYVFAPIQNGPVSHAPVNPGSFSAAIIRAWFSILCAAVK